MFPDQYIPPVIQELDVSMIKQQLADPCGRLGWDQEFCDQVHHEYLRFLALVYYHPELPILPSNTIDEFWHAHILDTRKYQKDCFRILGRFLHHTPAREPLEEATNSSSQANSDEPSYSKMHEEVWQQTLRLYEKHYQESPPARIWKDKPPCD